MHSLQKDNTPGETRRDLYDQAFVVLAKAIAARALNRCELLNEARSFLTQIEEKWASAAGGFYEGELFPQPPRRQNPHMHLFEAMLAVADTPWSLPQDILRANQFANFCTKRFFQPALQILPEFFDLQWNPLAGSDGYPVEPGHHFEWAWLLHRLAFIGGSNCNLVADALWQFANRYGIDSQRNICVDEINENGKTISQRARFWPQTERLKAALAYETSHHVRDDAMIIDCCKAIEQYLQAPKRGSFFDKLLPTGQFIDEPARASSLYHVICAYSELIGADIGYKERQ